MRRVAGTDRKDQKVGLSVILFAGALGLALGSSACNQSRFKGTSEKLNPTITRDFVQDGYAMGTTVLTQGHAGVPQTASFEQGEWGALDILVVIDNSGSMAEEQANLAPKLDSLMSRIDKADWQIAVTTTDQDDGCQRALIKKGELGAQDKFRTAISAGTSGDGVERGIAQAVDGLKCPAHAWVRPESTVVVLLVTDEDNCYADTSRGYTCGMFEPGRNGSHLTDYLSSIRTLGKDAKVYGILWHPTTPQAQCSTGAKQGDTYADVITQTGGTWGSICDADYTTTLQAISQDVAQILKYEFELANNPDPGTLVITVDGQPWTKYTIDQKLVKFTEAPPFGSKVAVAYSHGSTGELLSSFELEKLPVSDSIAVQIDGAPAQPGSFTWNESEKRLVFTTPPADSASIQVTYKEQAPLKNRFMIGKGADAKSIDVWFNDDEVSSKHFDYDAVTGEVVFDPAPPELAKIRITFKDAPGAD